jgi:glycosyltransferase involved in cell wall biosynthesis
MRPFPGKLGIQQRVLPSYRAPFFDLLASACEGGLRLFAGRPRPTEGITTLSQLRAADLQLGRNIHLLRGNLTLCYQFGLIDWLRNWEPDVLVVEANARCLSTPAAIQWMHRRGKPVIGWGLGSPAWGPLARFRQQGRLSFLRQFDALIAYSQRGADEYTALGVPRAQVFVAHNAVAAAPAVPPPLRPAAFEASANARQAFRPTILFVGRLQARKRVDDLLKACAQLESKPRLVIVGDGPQRGALESLAKEIYPEAEICGAKYGAELTPYFNEADLFVLPGTGGLAIQEAMSHGLPVIVARGDGTQDDLVRSENGWQIPPSTGDLEALVAALREALSDIPRLRRMGAESYRIVKEEINIEKMVETFVDVLDGLTTK